MGKRTRRRGQDGKIQLWAPGRKERWQALADAEGISLSDWLRRAGDREEKAQQKIEAMRQIMEI